MAGLLTLTGQQLFDLAVQAYEANAATPANVDVGSTAGAMFEAGALLGLQLQQILVYLAAMARLATSTGSDVDSFVNPFNVFRGGPTFGSGQVTVTYPSGQQTIPVGAQVQTSTGVIFTVIADPNNTTGDFNTILNGYIANPVATVLVQCNQNGLIGNVLANTINQVYAGTPAIVGSPVITNPAAFTNAIATESDSALKVRFAQAISGGGAGTVNAIVAATSAVQSGITFSYGDQWEATDIVFSGPDTATYNLTPNLAGYFTIIANIANQANTAGAGALCTAINNALMYAVRPAGILYNVLPPTIIPINFACKLVLTPGYTGPQVLPLAQAAATAFLNGFGLDQYGATKVCSIAAGYAAMLAVPGVQYADTLTYNGVGVDVQAPFGSQIVAGTVTGISN